eukprot:CAMPEP_0114145416 /NCGR_PEP_ID=MMETSP0043_2-20121206/20037_1 /TAXON_ID=464988 /ORGANISM="Hemiselmis andersenii, Strain CCMP644" /LENGTH=56 /DNA_ID=CAMNT_0001239837 /DNA_START=6 /DNA_END=173 /DNA_ORIENTATION=-
MILRTSHTESCFTKPWMPVPRDPIARCGAAIEHKISAVLEKWGLFVARRTWPVFIG